MSMTVEQRLYKFSCGETRGSSSSVFIEGDTAYSYGHHFPLVIRKDFGGGISFLINGDVYSVSTSRHTRYAIKQCTPNVQIPFSAFYAANVLPRGIEIIDSRPDSWVELCSACRKPVYYNYGRGQYVHEIGGAPLCDTTDHPGGDHISIHTLGAVLFKYQDRYFLSSMDSNETNRRTYFLSELYRKCRSVEDAFNSLKPVEVMRAEEDGTEVRRQGDVFFVKTELRSIDIASTIAKKRRLLGTNHYASESKANGRNLIYARGTIRHLPADRRPDHKMLSLGRPDWWAVFKNTALGSWSASGSVD